MMFEALPEDHPRSIGGLRREAEGSGGGLAPGPTAAGDEAEPKAKPTRPRTVMTIEAGSGTTAGS